MGYCGVLADQECYDAISGARSDFCDVGVCDTQWATGCYVHNEYWPNFGCTCHEDWTGILCELPYVGWYNNNSSDDTTEADNTALIVVCVAAGIFILIICYCLSSRCRMDEPDYAEERYTSAAPAEPAPMVNMFKPQPAQPAPLMAQPVYTNAKPGFSAPAQPMMHPQQTAPQQSVMMQQKQQPPPQWNQQQQAPPMSAPPPSYDTAAPAYL
jgi:hypothetical protein